MEITEAKSLLLAGGVSANKALREEVLAKSPVPVFIPPLKFCTDNAAMIGAAGYFRFLETTDTPIAMDVKPNWKLSA